MLMKISHTSEPFLRSSHGHILLLPVEINHITGMLLEPLNTPLLKQLRCQNLKYGKSVIYLYTVFVYLYFLRLSH